MMFFNKRHRRAKRAATESPELPVMMHAASGQARDRGKLSAGRLQKERDPETNSYSVYISSLTFKVGMDQATLPPVSGAGWNAAGRQDEGGGRERCATLGSEVLAQQFIRSEHEGIRGLGKVEANLMFPLF